MKPVKIIGAAAVLAVAATALLGVTSALATNEGTVHGNKTEGCAVDWRASSVLDATLKQDDPEFPGLMTDLNGNPVQYQNGGYIEDVTPTFGDPGLFEIHHFYFGSGSNLTQVWRIPTATDHSIQNAKVTFSLPANLAGQAITTSFDRVSTNANIKTWGPNYALYDWSPRADAVDNGDGTWTVDLGDLPGGQGTVYQFNIVIGATGLTINDRFVASAQLSGNYVPGEADGLCVQPNAEVATTEWKVQSQDCVSKRVTETRTRTTTEFSWSESLGEWVPGEPTETTETQTREMTTAEAAACTPPGAGPNQLANTGDSGTAIPFAVGALLLCLGGAALAMRRRNA